jgi:hypothetical protein
MIRSSVRLILPPPGLFTRQYPVDGSTVPWMQGLIPFRWTASQDQGATVTYHLTVNSTDYHRTFTTTDTTYSDSLSWFYGGYPLADVTWSVWANNGQDSLQASNGQGLFHLNANHAPGPFTRVAPRDTLIAQNFHVVCSWTHADDADGDPIRYLFHIEQRPGGRAPQPSDTITSDTSVTVTIPFPVDPGLSIHDFYWTVRATDVWDTTNASNGEGHFRMEIPDAAGGTGGLVITDYALRSSPNPFNSIASLTYDIPQASNVELKIFNLSGEQVTVLTQGYRAPGRYRVQWNASSQASGAYFAVLKAGPQTKIQKLMLLK